MQKGQNTPWGRADAIDEIGEGIYFASTPSHGGYFVPSGMLDAIPAAHQARALKWSGSRNWYEEDCEWASVAVAFPHLFDERAREAAAATMKYRAESERAERETQAAAAQTAHRITHPEPRLFD